jgi:15-cis-phytoene synthase
MSSLIGASTWRLAGETVSLPAAYQMCEEITRAHSTSFYFATALLSEEKRRAIRVLYAFCRWSDDLVDEPGATPHHSFDGWSARALEQDENSSDPVLIAWRDLRARYDLSRKTIDDLLAGLRMDLTIDRYESYDDLWLYCYRVASTVGLLSMQIIGHEPGADQYAIKLGVALQLTNILRDVGEDARRGRIYLPLKELRDFGLTAQDILDGCCDQRYQALMRYQIARVRRLYEESWPGIKLLHPDGRLAVAMAATVYRAILPEIERNGYNNHQHRAYVPAWRRFALLPRVWFQLAR